MDTMGQAKKAAGNALVLWAYASAVVGRTLTNKVLVFRELTEASAGSSVLKETIQIVTNYTSNI